MGKLPGRVVTVIASAAVVGLLQDSADGVVAGLLYVVFAEAAFGCAVQPVAFVSGDFPLVEGDAVQMAAAVAQQSDALAVGAEGFDSVAQFVVTVPPNVAAAAVA